MEQRPDAGHVPTDGRDAWAVDGFAPLPGDTVGLPGGDTGTVETVYLCAEPDGPAVTRWSWIVLEDGRLIEVAPRGCALYEPPELLKRGSGRFLDLVAQDGALVRFEERVRAGTWEARPVRLTLGGRRWRVTSTGTVTAQRLGPVPSSGWGQLRTPATAAGGLPPGIVTATGEGTAIWSVPDADRPSDELDVYFTCAAAGTSESDTLGLGIWMTDVCVAFGRRLGDTPATAGLSLLGTETARAGQSSN